MAKDGNDSFKPIKKDCDYGPEPVPKMRGGRRGRVPNSIANLRPAWKKGQSGNPLGTPKSVAELNRYVREKLQPMYDDLERLYYDPKTCTRDKVAIATLLEARGCGRPAVGVFHGTTGGPGGLPPGFLPEGEDGSPSFLLLRASMESGRRDKAALQAALREIEEEEAEQARARDDDLEAAQAAIARGEGDDVPAITRMLIHAKTAKRH